jgi:hypothetical protein
MSIIHNLNSPLSSGYEADDKRTSAPSSPQGSDWENEIISAYDRPGSPTGSERDDRLSSMASSFEGMGSSSDSVYSDPSQANSRSGISSPSRYEEPMLGRSTAGPSLLGRARRMNENPRASISGSEYSFGSTASQASHGPESPRPEESRAGRNSEVPPLLPPKDSNLAARRANAAGKPLPEKPLPGPQSFEQMGVPTRRAENTSSLAKRVKIARPQQRKEQGNKL